MKTNGIKPLFVCILLAVTSTMLFSCIEHNIVGRRDSNELSFVPTFIPETKASFFTNSNLASLGIFSFYTPSGNFTWTNQSPNFMNNQLVSRVGLGPWAYAPKRYWPIATGGKLSFFAYAPHSSVLALTDGALTLEASTAVSPSLLVTLPSKQADQTDVLVSAPMLNKRITDVVNGSLPLSFAHVLSSIDFQAQTTSGTVQIFSVKVFYTNTVKRSGKVSLSTGSWLSGSLTGAYTSVDGTSDAKKDIILNTSTAIGSGVTNLTSSSSHLLLIPQALTTGDLKVEIIYSQDGGASKTKTISLPAQTYVAGYNYPILFAFGPVELFPIPLPPVVPPTGLSNMCGCGYNRDSNPTHNMTFPHYDANSAGTSSWVLNEKEDWTSTLQFKNNINFYIYGKFKVSSWWGSSTNGKIYVMPGGTLDLTSISGFNSGMSIDNLGTILWPDNLSMNSGSNLASATPINAANTTLSLSGNLTLGTETTFKEIKTNQPCTITVYKCLRVLSEISLGNDVMLDIRSYVRAGSLVWNSAATVKLAKNSIFELDNNFTLGYVGPFKIINTDATGYAVLKCPNFTTNVPNTSTMIYGNIDIHGTITDNNWGLPTPAIWDSRIKFNGPTTIPGDGCRPAFP